LQWAYSYFAYKRSARIITGMPEHEAQKDTGQQHPSFPQRK